MPTSRSGGPLPFLDHLAADSARFREVLTTAPAGARVPTCPDWDADDLLWHLGEVQWFWGEIAERGLTDPADLDAVNATREDRPGDRGGCSTSSTARASGCTGCWETCRPRPRCGCGPTTRPPATSGGDRLTRP